jgi:D-alanyl-lipoteichoic acid acyltransferase DltB (MBOAT superfamily)
LIAGPIVHNREIMPQFGEPATYRLSAENFTVGSSIFLLGLLKKCLLADPTSAIVSPGFAHPEALTLLPSWHVALSYSLQLYFDFSGYSGVMAQTPKPECSGFRPPSPHISAARLRESECVS